MKIKLSTPRRSTALLALAATLGCGQALAANMQQLIADALNRDPAILEAQANEEVATMRLKASRAQHYPTVGTQAGYYVSNPNDMGRPFRGIVGRVNLFAGGSIESAIKRDSLQREALHHKTSETREVIAGQVAQLYLEAVRAYDFLQAEQRNLERHNKIMNDLKIVVANDAGRNYELVQAESRAFQVRTRIVQYEKSIDLAMSKLTRYTPLKPTLHEPVPELWRTRIGQDIAAASRVDQERAVHPAIAAQKQQAEATREGHRTMFRQRMPRVDFEVGGGNQSYSRVNLSWEFLDRSSDYTVQSASKEIMAAEQRTDLMEREVSQRAATAKADMAQSQREIAAAKEQIASSTKVAELYELQFKVGRRTLIELVNAYQEIASVELSLATAENNYRQAAINYLDSQALLAQWAAPAAPAMAEVAADAAAE